MTTMVNDYSALNGNFNRNRKYLLDYIIKVVVIIAKNVI